uniref:FAD-binding oxidoreductase n=1 Tax=Streptomyces xiaopingdaonensis TaxID=1565415 RepID=UPI0003640601
MDHTEKHTPGLADVAVVRPGQDTYDERRAGFQLARPHRPELIALPADARQVAAVAEYARRTGLPLAVQRTGHGRTAPTEGGVLLDTGRLRDVRVDPGTRTAWVAAGATWQDVLDAAAPHGLAPPSGSAPSVGAVGYTLAGGLGLLARQYGYAADLVRRMDVVTPPGERVRATPEHRAELFWALRGGGGLGTVTGMEIELLPVARVWGGRLVYGERDLPGVLAAYPEWTDGLPEGFGSSLAIAVQPDLPAVPEELRGRYTVQLGVVWNGSAAAGERLLAPLREDAEPLADTSG